MTNRHRRLTTTSPILIKIGVCGYLIAKTHWCKYYVSTTNTFLVIGGQSFGGAKKSFSKNPYIFFKICLNYNMLYMVEIRKKQGIQI